MESNIWLKLLIILFAWVSPALESALLLYGLVFLDTVTGVWVSIEAGNKFTSKGLVPTIKKVILYTIYVVATHSFQQHFVKSDSIDVFRLLISLPILRELTSVIENVSTATKYDIATEAKKILLSFFNKLKKED